MTNTNNIMRAILAIVSINGNNLQGPRAYAAAEALAAAADLAATLHRFYCYMDDAARVADDEPVWLEYVQGLAWYKTDQLNDLCRNLNKLAARGYRAAC